VLQCDAVCCILIKPGRYKMGVERGLTHYKGVSQRTATHCNTLLTVCCIVTRCVAACCSVLQFVVVFCTALQCDAVCCSVLQCVAV